ncbi:MAG: hypothetical protein Q8R28_19060 [Dehalococcoidia bacterium]|nr:hypothetical protein [Dehalococcoidia bacterium]
MAVEPNKFMAASQRLAERLRASDERAEKNAGRFAPFGMEQVRAETEARRWGAMGEEERREFIEKNGVEHALGTAARAEKLKGS